MLLYGKLVILFTTIRHNLHLIIHHIDAYTTLYMTVCI